MISARVLFNEAAEINIITSIKIITEVIIKYFYIILRRASEVLSTCHLLLFVLIPAYMHFQA